MFGSTHHQCGLQSPWARQRPDGALWYRYTVTQQRKQLRYTGPEHRVTAISSGTTNYIKAVSVRMSRNKVSSSLATLNIKRLPSCKTPAMATCTGLVSSPRCDYRQTNYLELLEHIRGSACRCNTTTDTEPRTVTLAWPADVIKLPIQTCDAVLKQGHNHLSSSFFHTPYIHSCQDERNTYLNSPDANYHITRSVTLLGYVLL